MGDFNSRVGKNIDYIELDLLNTGVSRAVNEVLNYTCDNKMNES